MFCLNPPLPPPTCSSRSSEKRHKRRRHDKSLDRETSLWWHILAKPLCCQPVNQQTSIPCHLCTVLHCVFCHVSLCVSRVKQRIFIRNIINEGRLRHACVFFFSVYISIWWYQQQKDARIMTPTITVVSMGQFRNNFKKM